MNAPIRFPAPSVSPYYTQTHSSTISATARDSEGGGELIKAGFDTRGDILLSNHDRGSQLHTLPVAAEPAYHSEQQQQTWSRAKSIKKHMTTCV